MHGQNFPSIRPAHYIVAVTVHFFPTKDGHRSSGQALAYASLRHSASNSLAEVDIGSSPPCSDELFAAGWLQNGGLHVAEGGPLRDALSQWDVTTTNASRVTAVEQQQQQQHGHGEVIVRPQSHRIYHFALNRVDCLSLLMTIATKTLYRKRMEPITAAMKQLTPSISRRRGCFAS